ncbi:MAG: type IV pilus biogenesis/stability protein PilW [Rhodoferax sp.]|nr:type IV pilus biogenesis/stability protein PilW [Rhodoferax sp.]
MAVRLGAPAAPSLHRGAGWAALRCLFAAAVLSLVACAGGPQRTDKSDLVTASDETDTRKRARIRLELAVNYFSEGKTTIALDELKQSIAVDPGLFEAHNLRGLIYMRLNEFSLADDSFRQALLLNPKAATVQHNYGLLLCQQGRMAASADMFSAALANPGYNERAKTWMIQGLCQAKAGQAQAAETSLLNAYQLDPGNPVIAYNLGVGLYKRGEYPQAQRYLARLNSSELANAESLWLGAKTAKAMGDSQSLRDLGQTLVQRFPSSKESLWLERRSFHE